MNARTPTFTIITVCWNAGDLLRPTFESLLQQTCVDYELIVIDGASTDHSLDVIAAYGDLVSRCVSEPDRGIYDAMNKGVRLARGRWLHFLNANDCFADAKVLANVVKAAECNRGANLLYGDVYLGHPGDKKLSRFDWLRPWNLRMEHLCHQAVFARRELFDSIGGFDLQYRINADYDWLLRVFNSGAQTCYLGFPVVYYDTEGFSSRDLDAVSAERDVIRRRHQPTPLYRLLELMHRAVRKGKRLVNPGPRIGRHTHVGGKSL